LRVIAAKIAIIAVHTTHKQGGLHRIPEGKHGFLYLPISSICRHGAQDRSNCGLPMLCGCPGVRPVSWCLRTAARRARGCSTVALPTVMVCGSTGHGVRLDEFVDIRLSLTSLVWQDYVSDLHGGKRLCTRPHCHGVYCHGVSRLCAAPIWHDCVRHGVSRPHCHGVRLDEFVDVDCGSSKTAR